MIRWDVAFRHTASNTQVPSQGSVLHFPTLLSRSGNDAECWKKMCIPKKIHQVVAPNSTSHTWFNCNVKSFFENAKELPNWGVAQEGQMLTAAVEIANSIHINTLLTDGVGWKSTSSLRKFPGNCFSPGYTGMFLKRKSNDLSLKRLWLYSFWQPFCCNFEIEPVL